MNNLREIPEAGLLVMCGALSPGQAEDLEGHCEQLMARPPAGAGPLRERGLTDGMVHSISLGADSPAIFGLKALEGVLPLISYYGFGIATINRQQPGSIGDLHTDGLSALPPTAVIHASSGGRFEYDTSFSHPGDDSPLPGIDVDAGDLVLQLHPGLWHRGRNLSDRTRYNLVLWRRNPMFDLLHDTVSRPV